MKNVVSYQFTNKICVSYRATNGDCLWNIVSIVPLTCALNRVEKQLIWQTWPNCGIIYTDLQSKCRFLQTWNRKCSQNAFSDQFAIEMSFLNQIAIENSFSNQFSFSYNLQSKMLFFTFLQSKMLFLTFLQSNMLFLSFLQSNMLFLSFLQSICSFLPICNQK